MGICERKTLKSVQQQTSSFFIKFESSTRKSNEKSNNSKNLESKQQFQFRRKKTTAI